MGERGPMADFEGIAYISQEFAYGTECQFMIM